jgi:hypothetical protein
MRITLGERALATVLVVPTAVAVIMLAVVQYRWSEEVRSATSSDKPSDVDDEWHLNLFRLSAPPAAAPTVSEVQLQAVEISRPASSYPGSFRARLVSDAGLLTCGGTGRSGPKLRHLGRCRSLHTRRRPPPARHAVPPARRTD